MNVFVTGATGVLGRGVVPRLVDAGHHVRGVARGDAKARQLREQGAEPVAVDLFDAGAVKDAVAGADAVLHLATAIPPMKDMRDPAAWVANNRLRTDTTRYLVDAALAHGVRTFVAESISFLYDDAGDRWLTEDDHFDDDGGLKSTVELEQQVVRFGREAGVDARAVVLRFGLFYGPDTRSTGEMLDVAKRGMAPFLGRKDAYMSSIHTDDAARAVVAALDAPTGIYNVTDEPVTRKEAADAFANAFGLKRQRFLPTPIARFATRKTSAALLRSQRVSSARFRAATGWEPHYRDIREGWLAVARQRGEGNHDA
jgi:nucleoside-diphosphate-sugar epimerase